MSDELPKFDSATSEQAWMARNGLHDLLPWWDPERGHVDPLDDPEVRQTMRFYISNRYRHLEALRAEPTP